MQYIKSKNLMKKSLFLAASILTLIPKIALAHCPLCTVGAGALAVLAASLGISSLVVGVMIGAFALALGLWIGKMPKKKYIPYQYIILVVVIFLGTIIPIMPLVKDYGPLYVSIIGEYGTLLHNTYTVNLFLAGSILGAFIMFVAPFISRFVTKTRSGRTVPYQGISIVLALLIIVSVIIEILS
ncbi:MAG: hypothetical protein A3E94_00885 [Candidatus Zambryskibacteria bacterium RIFCSPHIGHO2_12_FULL_44_12b]|uniref:Uncharacterized protein n=1 Tax=Candidatus Zambryskibacteria bacterium RIFCSPLOWO2_01_FULL_45_21 TaxID=1802761 RepID=A0A1G2U2Y3_9BACT|nr:MAG: hypothetical protein A3E94_00885 [Candidatus Zambryskibacteria bacterium RIFCSPHIGHO2_12_FULL_44_12b]OHB03877.1 MAG: hypothetical protein A3B14_00895 [Candidatus Zambryskibacteria bacterium RIFCSPLOWO2_01_FULL_45_21]